MYDAQAPADETRDQHIAALRAVLQRTIPHLAFCAGLEASTHPGQSEMLLAVANDAQAVLDRTTPA
ncbi:MULTISPECIES: hypothetical protein [unclassified Streptomyces]|uniref:hypothetical protein n=1 Tax=unclassified Streptomyces TaxID=2593676 RepID=UPI00381DF20D